MRKNYFYFALAAFLLLGPACFAKDHQPAASAASEAARINAAGIEQLEAAEYAKAEESFRAAISLNPSQPKYFNNLAISLMRRNCYKEAYPFLKQAISMNENYAKALANMAITCFYLGSYMDAYRFYLRAEEADRAYTAARFERNKATARLEELSKENPDNSDYKQMLEVLKDSRRNQEQTTRR